MKPISLVLPALTAALLAGGPSSAAEPAARARSSVPRPKAGQLSLPFIHDDYPKALQEARARRIPIFVESWAPW